MNTMPVKSNKIHVWLLISVLMCYNHSKDKYCICYFTSLFVSSSLKVEINNTKYNQFTTRFLTFYPIFVVGIGIHTQITVTQRISYHQIAGICLCNDKRMTILSF